MQSNGNGPPVTQSKPPRQRRREFLKVRITPAERIDLDEAAARLGKSVSEFVRDTVLYQAAIVNSVDGGEEQDSGLQFVLSPVEFHQYQRFKLAELQKTRERTRVC